MEEQVDVIDDIVDFIHCHPELDITIREIKEIGLSEDHIDRGKVLDYCLKNNRVKYLNSKVTKLDLSNDKLRSFNKFDTSNGIGNSSINFNEKTGIFELFLSSYGYWQLIYVNSTVPIHPLNTEIYFRNERNKFLFKGEMKDYSNTNSWRNLLDRNNIHFRKLCLYLI